MYRKSRSRSPRAISPTRECVQTDKAVQQNANAPNGSKFAKCDTSAKSEFKSESMSDMGRNSRPPASIKREVESDIRQECKSDMCVKFESDFAQVKAIHSPILLTTGSPLLRFQMHLVDSHNRLQSGMMSDPFSLPPDPIDSYLPSNVMTRCELYLWIARFRAINLCHRQVTIWLSLRNRRTVKPNTYQWANSINARKIFALVIEYVKKIAPNGSKRESCGVGCRPLHRVIISARKMVSPNR